MYYTSQVHYLKSNPLEQLDQTWGIDAHYDEWRILELHLLPVHHFVHCVSLCAFCGCSQGWRSQKTIQHMQGAQEGMLHCLLVVKILP